MRREGKGELGRGGQYIMLLKKHNPMSEKIYKNRGTGVETVYGCCSVPVACILVR